MATIYPSYLESALERAAAVEHARREAEGATAAAVAAVRAAAQAELKRYSVAAVRAAAQAELEYYSSMFVWELRSSQRHGALYGVKRTSGGTYTFDGLSFHRQEPLRPGVHCGYVVVHSPSGKVVGYETLSAAQDATKGALPPEVSSCGIPPENMADALSKLAQRIDLSGCLYQPADSQLSNLCWTVAGTCVDTTSIYPPIYPWSSSSPTSLNVP